MPTGVKLKFSVAILAALAISAAAFKLDLYLVKRRAAERWRLSWKEQIRRDDEQYRKELEEQTKKIHAQASNESRSGTRTTPQ